LDDPLELDVGAEEEPRSQHGELASLNSGDGASLLSNAIGRAITLVNSFGPSFETTFRTCCLQKCSCQGGFGAFISTAFRGRFDGAWMPLRWLRPQVIARVASGSVHGIEVALRLKLVNQSRSLHILVAFITATSSLLATHAAPAAPAPAPAPA